MSPIADTISEIRQNGMSPNISIISNGKKFMWDGKLYATKDDASRAEEAYRKDNFEVESLEQNQKCLVYTRRVAKKS